MLTINKLQHPDWIRRNINWTKYRLIMQGGKVFADNYLKYYDSMELRTEYEFRKELCYTPAFAQVELLKIHNAITRRFGDVVREQPLPEMVDLDGNSMAKFMSGILLELLTTGRVGIYVDRAADPLVTLLDDTKTQPYVYSYQVEDILNWNHYCNPTDVLLQDNYNTYANGLVSSIAARLRHVFINEDGQIVAQTGKDASEIKVQGPNVAEAPRIVNSAPDVPDEQIVNLSMFPFKIFDIRDSILVNVADYQVTLLNLESMQNFFAYKLSHPVYTEQTDNAGVPPKEKQKESTVTLGPFKGRTYPRNTERPDFISPSTDGMEAKEIRIQRLKDDIRELMLSTVATLASSSEQVKAYENSAFEDGLAAIAETLEEIENWIHKVWAMYVGKKPNKAVYPKCYAPASDKERTERSSSMLGMIDKFPSQKAKKTIIKMAFRQLTIGNITNDELVVINNEIDNASYLDSTATNIQKDVEAGLCTKETASMARGYPEGEAEEAAEEHIEHVAAIAAAQMKYTPGPGGVQKDPAAAGAKELSPNPKTNAAVARKIEGGGRKESDGDDDESTGTE